MLTEKQGEESIERDRPCRYFKLRLKLANASRLLIALASCSSPRRSRNLRLGCYMPKSIYAHDPKISNLIDEGCRRYRGNPHLKIKAIQRALEAESGKKIPYDTLNNRARHNILPPKQAHADQQLLSPAQEKVIVLWCLFLSATGHPLGKRELAWKVKDIIQHEPNEKWVHAFLRRHPELKLGKCTGLDPKRARAFNPAIVNDSPYCNNN